MTDLILPTEEQVERGIQAGIATELDFAQWDEGPQRELVTAILATMLNDERFIEFSSDDEYSIGFSPKAPETEEDMRKLLDMSTMPSFRLELDRETYERFRPMIEEYERKRDETLAANEFLFRDG